MAVCWKAADAGKRRRGLRLAAAGHRLASGAPAAVAGSRVVLATRAVGMLHPGVSFRLSSGSVFPDQRRSVDPR